MNDQSEKYKKLINSQRWLKIRKKLISNHPLCFDCLRKDIITPATDLHHIIPINQIKSESEIERLFFSNYNLVPLCHECHVKRHSVVKSKSKESVTETNKSINERFAKEFL